jgi:hypothetical protein
MTRVLVALAAVLACGVVTSTAFGSPKGWFVGGGIVSRSASGDLDGKDLLVDADATRAGSVGELDSGSGLAFNAGYNFGSHFGLEYLESHSLHVASHDLEKSETDAFLTTPLLGIRLSAGLSDSFDVFACLGMAAAVLRYERYGHKGRFSPAFMPTSARGLPGYGAGRSAVRTMSKEPSMSSPSLHPVPPDPVSVMVKVPVM